MEITRDEHGSITMKFDDGGYVDARSIDINLFYEIWQELKKLNKEVERSHGEVETIRLQERE